MTNYKLSNTQEVKVEIESTADIINGILLILKYQPTAYFASEHDVLYFGSYSLEQMTEEELQKMKSWGWYEEYESWTHNT